MSLFEVKGWNVPSQVAATAPSSQPSRKRRMSANDPDKVQSAQINLEKLMRKVHSLEAAQGSKKTKRDKKGKNKGKEHAEVTSPTDFDAKAPKKAFKKRQERKNRGAGTTINPDTESPEAPVRAPKRARTKTSQDLPAEPVAESLIQHVSPSSTRKRKASDSLTPLQSSMKGSLDGARFRWINEMLYTTSSGEGHKLMREEPNLFEEYHAGFRRQVRSWPSNPVSHYIENLSSYPRGTVIADLGCGDAALARNLVQKGYCVLSFDLVSDGVFVLEADVCKKIPLPGSEESPDGSQGQVVDVCICALSLMSLDWIDCIREAWRILRLGGELRIAEVASRFTDMSQFISTIRSLGFKFKSKDETNTHFTTFEFEKVARERLSEQDWETLRNTHTVLKPCEYKRR